MAWTSGIGSPGSGGLPVLSVGFGLPHNHYDLEPVFDRPQLSDVSLWGTSTGPQITIRYTSRYQQPNVKAPVEDFTQHVLQARLTIIADAGGTYCMIERPQETAEAVCGFLKKLA